MVVSIWRVIPEHTPRVKRRCPRCDEARWFASSDKFRVNANGRRLDAWLIYRCPSCKHPWNMTVHERASPESIGAERLAKLTDNHVGLAWACAFDAPLIKRAGGRVDLRVPFSVEGQGASIVRMSLPHPFAARLDRVLAKGLGVSRSAVGGLGLDRRALRRAVHDGQEVVLT